ncbi:hypothetical protein QAD02_010994 [Eretmocerus hayati]|uniref:Uncharacterized protein n=1 Tax=Eretmocerus hayati TaxID=131215 RepID=A0ACC2NWH3_9HYME|nr:hypothetical protein QAD02_010994 [Eretmocerus hayati]
MSLLVYTDDLVSQEKPRRNISANGRSVKKGEIRRKENKRGIEGRTKGVAKCILAGGDKNVGALESVPCAKAWEVAYLEVQMVHGNGQRAAETGSKDIRKEPCMAWNVWPILTDKSARGAGCAVDSENPNQRKRKRAKEEMEKDRVKKHERSLLKLRRVPGRIGP